MARISRATYAQMYGPTVGDKVRLADTDLIVEVERDFTLYGEEVKFGGGKVIRDGMGQSQATRAEGAMDSLSANGMVYGDEFGAVREGGFHLHVVDHVGDTFHAIGLRNHVGGSLHQVCNTPAVAGPFHNKVRDEGNRLWMIEFHAAFKASPGNDSRHRNQQFILFPRRQMHIFSSERPNFRQFRRCGKQL